MHIVYCRLETEENNTLDFNFEQQLKLSREDYNLVFRAYIYTLYYFSTKNEMSDLDLDFYDLYSPPFTKGVFILKFGDKFLKLSYTDTPVSYHLSDFFPETGESTIISTQEREIYSTLVENYKIDTWKNYKLVYSIFIAENKKTNDDNKLSLVSSYGDDYTIDNDNEEESSLSLGSSSVTYEEYSDNPASSSTSFDKYSIKERRELLEDYKNNLKEAIDIKELNTSIENINKKLKYYSSLKKEIENFNIIIKKKEKERNDFKDIHWMSQNLYNQMNLYIKKKKKYDGDLVAYKQKLEKNKKDIESIIPDNIFKNIAFLPSFLIAIVTFALSWIMREQFWYLAGVAIVFFTISFYYLWGYLDYVEYIIKLKREKTFYEKKLIKIEKNFEKEFASLEMTLKKEAVEDIAIPISRYEDLKEFDISLEAIKEKLQTFIAQKFSDDTQVKFENLINEKNLLLEQLKSFKNLDLNYKEIEYKIIELKKSIKEYEKEELDEFSLDDDEETIDVDEKTIELEPKENLEYKYELNKLKFYFTQLKEHITENISELYDKIKKDFIDILSFSIHYKFSLDIDFENNEFFFMSEKEIEWNSNQEQKFKFFLQYALIKYLSIENSTTVFMDLFKLNKDYEILFSTYLDELSNSQIVYTEES